MDKQEISSYQQTNDIVMKCIGGKKFFKLSTLEKEIAKRGLPMRVGITYTVREYLNDLVEEGRLICNSKTEWYRRLTKSELIRLQAHNFSI